MKLKSILFIVMLTFMTGAEARDIFTCQTSSFSSPGRNLINLTLSSEDAILSVGAISNLRAVGVMTNDFELVTTAATVTRTIGNGLGEITIDFTTTARGLSDEGEFVDLEIPGHLTVRFELLTGQLTNIGKLRLENTLRTISPRLNEEYQLDLCRGVVDEF